jgi:hypothetical protein
VGNGTPEGRNVIGPTTYAAFGLIGIWGTETSGNVVQGNYIGTDVTGTVLLDGSAKLNGAEGVHIDGSSNNLIGGASPGSGNVICGNESAVTIRGPGASNNVVQGNLIGTDATGTSALGNTLGIGIQDASNNLIGGTTPQARNTISGGLEGVSIFGSESANNVIQGNYIGTNVTGSLDIGNYVGVGVGGNANNNTIGGPNPGSANVISGNVIGIELDSDSVGNRVEGNLIGTTASGNSPLGNDTWGIEVGVDSSHYLIGGTSPGEGNVIANNGQGGILIGHDDFGSPPPISGNSILGNSIYNNGGLGIDLGLDGGVTPNDTNDADSGPNDLLNFPALSSAVLTGSDLTISGSINTEQNKTLRIEFFANPSADPSGYGEGQTFVGFTDVVMGANNTMNFSQTLSVSGVTPGQFITATATDELGNTSEFSLALAVS